MPFSSSCLHSRTICFSRGFLRSATAAAQPPPGKMNWFWSYCSYLYTFNFCVQLDMQSLQQLFSLLMFLASFSNKDQPLTSVSQPPNCITAWRATCWFCHLWPHATDDKTSCGSRFCHLCFNALFLAAGVWSPAQCPRSNQSLCLPRSSKPAKPCWCCSGVQPWHPAPCAAICRGSILRDNVEAF